MLKKIKVKIDNKKRTNPNTAQAMPLDTATVESIFTNFNFMEIKSLILPIKLPRFRGFRSNKVLVVLN